jgi:hypothetical protein
VIGRVGARVPGDIIGLQLSGNTYLVRVIDRKGRLLRLKVSAQSGEILSVEGQ